MKSINWRLILRILTVAVVGISVFWFGFEPKWDPVVAFMSSLVTFVSTFIGDKNNPLSFGESSALRNRQAMLDLVKNIWIGGVLEESLYKAVLIDLGMETRFDTVEHPWQMELRSVESKNVSLPPGTQIDDVFRKANEALLLLGEPGSGKTTLLLELARVRIDLAKRDGSEPIPVVFNLSSWADKKQPFDEWLSEELNKKYNIPRKIAVQWVEGDCLMLLLDGLDEVQVTAREDCVKAINDYRREHGLVPLVVCSRTSDYESLTGHLQLQGAVLLQPLSRAQIGVYFRLIGQELSPLHKMLDDDEVLQDLVRSPLMLSVMVLAYSGMPKDALQKLDGLEERRRHIFESYVQRMLSRPRGMKNYSEKDTLAWLSWLAKNMIQHNQSVFLIEQLQPSWLYSQQQRRGYAFGSRLLGVSALALLYAPILYAFSNEYYRRGTFLAYAIVSFLAAIVIGFIDGTRIIKSPADPRKRGGWADILHILRVVGKVLGICLLAAILIVITSILLGQNSPDEALSYYVFPLGILFGIRGSQVFQTLDIRTFESLKFSWRRFLIVYLIFGLGMGSAFYALSVVMEKSIAEKYTIPPPAQVWDARTWTPLPLGDQYYPFLGFDPAGKHIFVVDRSLQIEIRDLQGKPLASIDCGRSYCPPNAISRDGSRVITWDLENGQHQLWDEKGVSLLLIEPSLGFPFFSPNGLYFAAHAPDNGVLHIWSADGDSIATIKIPDGSGWYWLNTNDAQAQEQSILVDADDVKIYDVRGRLIQRVPDTYQGYMRFNSDRSLFLTSPNDDSTALHDSTGRLLATFALAGYSNPEAYFSPEDNYIAFSSDELIGIWDRHGEFVMKTQTPNKWNRRVNFCPDEQCFVVGDYPAQLMDVEGHLIQTFGSTDRFDGFAIGPDDTFRIITVKSTNEFIQLWDEEGALIKTIEGSKPFEDIHVSPQGDYLITILAEEEPSLATWWNKHVKIHIWNAYSGELIVEQSALVTDADVRFSQDGTHFITSVTPFSAHREYGIVWALALLMLGVFFGLRIRLVETKASPNQGMRMTAKTAFFLWLILALTTGILASIVILVLMGSVQSGPELGAYLTLYSQLLDPGAYSIQDVLAFLVRVAGVVGPISVPAALGFGGLDVVYQFVLRFLLWRSRAMPWRLAKFLDHATDLVFLRKVGGGYIFVHRSLMEYFASLP